MMMMCLSTYFWLLQLGKTDWMPSKPFGGDGGESYNLHCSNGSWIDYIEGGIYSAIEYLSRYPLLKTGVVSKFNARCSNGEKFERACGYSNCDKYNLSNFTTEEGLHSVEVSATHSIHGLRFYNHTALVGKLNDLDGTMVECPENEVITGLRIRCGSWMDQISFYCGTDGLFIPTSTPTQQSDSSGQQLYEMQWFWWAFTTILTVAVVICYRLFLYRFSTRLDGKQTSSNVKCTCLDCCEFLYRT